MPSTAPEAVAGARPIIPVAAGCLVNDRGEVLICQRPPGKIAAGKWEFPGGKIEPGETAELALVRELREELGIELRAQRPLIRVRHGYSDRTVILDTWRVTRWDHPLVGHDGQAFAWVAPDDLHRWDLLAADVPIVSALRLPEHYVFTPPDADEDMIAGSLPQLPSSALLRLRLPQLGDAPYARLAERLAPLARARGIRLMLDRAPELAVRLGAGWHAWAERLPSLARRPVPKDTWFAVSCHDAAELARARALGADFAVVGSVLETFSHPGLAPMGWDGFAALVPEAGLPVYAIGGVTPDDLPTAWRCGGQGVAGITAYWRPGGSPSGGEG